MQEFLQLIVTGLVIGSAYALVAMGFALIYKSTSIINFAQGEFVLVGGYVCWWLYTGLHVPIVWAFLITMVIAVFMGMVLERLMLRPMIGEPIISVIMITIALAAVLKSMVTMLWGTQIKVFTPAIFSQKAIYLGPVLVSEVYLWTFGFAAVFLGVFAAFFKFTRVGISMRAVANDQQVAQSMGISVKRVFAISWSIGALVSAVGGILVGNINGINITLSDFGLKVFPAVILGGLESIGGAIIGGLTIGVLENIMGSYLDVYLGGGVKEIAPFIVLIIILMIKPYGLFGIKEIERV
ncbi:MAG: branched-chain amino acid ABC transporter permease [Desulfarculaceae bacterium]|nr:branched-chain amino acid ABC transporter permease [Desulfarculaceae bacterium]MCF8072279.1 branched-chain amino acid ABC transporter permease [Desulfarculaceae bacterium]MCF8100200.1 branched-chain amino acid ABC transporter permease [Desulfarculaceae bacterium]MCF8116227.1 branched-chain amino acid ABC transporter permease [Desulfarculaceae bacterium]